MCGSSGSSRVDARGVARELSRKATSIEVSLRLASPNTRPCSSPLSPTVLQLTAAQVRRVHGAVRSPPAPVVSTAWWTRCEMTSSRPGACARAARPATRAAAPDARTWRREIMASSSGYVLDGSAEHRAAVDVERGAVHEAGGGRAQEQDRGGHVVGAAHALHRQAGGDLLLEL